MNAEELKDVLRKLQPFTSGELDIHTAYVALNAHCRELEATEKERTEWKRARRANTEKDAEKRTHCNRCSKVIPSSDVRHVDFPGVHICTACYEYQPSSTESRLEAAESRHCGVCEKKMTIPEDAVYHVDTLGKVRCMTCYGKTFEGIASRLEEFERQVKQRHSGVLVRIGNNATRLDTLETTVQGFLDDEGHAITHQRLCEQQVALKGRVGRLEGGYVAPYVIKLIQKNQVAELKEKQTDVAELIGALRMLHRALVQPAFGGAFKTAYDHAEAELKKRGAL